MCEEMFTREYLESYVKTFQDLSDDVTRQFKEIVDFMNSEEMAHTLTKSLQKGIQRANTEHAAKY